MSSPNLAARIRVMPVPAPVPAGMGFCAAASIAGTFSPTGSGTNQRASSKPTYLQIRSCPGKQFENVSYQQRCLRTTQQSPSRVLVLRVDFARWLIVLLLDIGGARNMRRPAELQAWNIFHAVNAELRHESPIVVDTTD